jgi:hypothetical protein
MPSPRAFSQYYSYRFLFLGLMIWLITLTGCTIPTSTITVPPNANGQHILYIVDELTPPSALAPTIRTLFEPTEVKGWDFVAHLTPSTRIDSIIIDGTIPIKRINAEWVAWAYDHEVKIVALDRYTIELAEIVDDPSITADNWVTGDDPYPGHFYVAVSRSIHANCSPANTTRVVENIESGAEAPVQNLVGRCGSSGSRATYSLEEPLGLEALRHVVNR